MNRYKVWKCKIVVPIDADLPEGFDQPPRQAAIEAVMRAGIEVLDCYSGWGGSLNDIQQELTDRDHLPEVPPTLSPKDEAVELESEIRTSLNRCCAENASNTPDFILAQYLITCLEAFNVAVQQREIWYGKSMEPGELGLTAASDPPVSAP